MKDIQFVARFDNSELVVEFLLSDIVYSMGHQCAEDVDIEVEVGDALAYLQRNFDHAIIEIKNPA